VRSNYPPDFENVGDRCALIMNASRTLIRFSAPAATCLRHVVIVEDDGRVRLADGWVSR
jgi:hypothetical protein